jgi:hypothetical protein
MTDDEVIDAYLNHPKTEDTLEDPKFRELSERFHVIARQTFYEQHTGQRLTQIGAASSLNILKKKL